MIKRDQGLIGHVNRAVGEVSGAVRAATPGAEFDVEQDGELVVVDDRSTSTLSLIDSRTFQIVNSPQVPHDTHLAVVDGHAVVWTETPLSVWRLTVAQLGDLSLDRRPRPDAGGGRRRLGAAGPDGTVVAVDVDGARLLRSPADGGPPTASELGDVAAATTAVTLVGDTAVLLTSDGVVEVGADGAVSTTVPLPGGSDGGGAGPARPRGQCGRRRHRRGLDPHDPGRWRGGDRCSARAAAAQPVAPIVYGGCVFALATAPPTFTRVCDGVRRSDHGPPGRVRRLAAPAAGERLGVDQRPRHRRDVGHEHRRRAGPDRRLGRRSVRRRQRRRHPERRRRHRAAAEPRRRQRRVHTRRRDRRGRRQRAARRPRRPGPHPGRSTRRRRCARQRRGSRRRRAARHVGQRSAHRSPGHTDGRPHQGAGHSPGRLPGPPRLRLLDQRRARRDGQPRTSPSTSSTRPARPTSPRSRSPTSPRPAPAPPPP